MKRVSSSKKYLEDGSLPTFFQQAQGTECLKSTDKEVSGHTSLHDHSYWIKSSRGLKGQLEGVIDRAESYCNRLKVSNKGKSSTKKKVNDLL